MGACVGPFGWFDRLTHERMRGMGACVGPFGWEAHHERAGEGGMSGNQPPVRPELVEGCMGACIGPFMWFVLSLSKDAKDGGLRWPVRLVAHHERGDEREPTTRSS